MSILGAVQQKFLDPHPFSSPRVISRRFCISLSSVKEIPRRELGLEKSSRRWVYDLLSDDRKKLQVDVSRKLLSLLGMYAEHHFEGIAAGDESRFRCSSYSDSMFAGSRENAVPRIRCDISGQKLLVQFSVHRGDF
jgi:hypothetical protein